MPCTRHRHTHNRPVAVAENRVSYLRCKCKCTERNNQESAHAFLRMAVQQQAWKMVMQIGCARMYIELQIS